MSKSGEDTLLNLLNLDVSRDFADVLFRPSLDLVIVVVFMPDVLSISMSIYCFDHGYYYYYYYYYFY